MKMFASDVYGILACMSNELYAFSQGGEPMALHDDPAYPLRNQQNPM